MSESVSHPSPITGLNLAPLFEASARHVSREARCLEIGAGAGLWSLACLERGATVSASDLPHVDLSGLSETAARQNQHVEVLYGDLFASVNNRRFDHIFFNPPFHVAPIQSEQDQAYFGGADGQVVKRYLSELTAHLSPEGIGWIILPERERLLYDDLLKEFNLSKILSTWRPLLGVVSLWALRAPDSLSPSIQSRPMNAVSECFKNLSQVMNTHSCEVLTLRGKVNNLALERALKTVVARHLLTRSTLAPTGECSAQFPLRGWTWFSQHPSPTPAFIVETLDEREERELSDAITAQGQWINNIPRLILDRVWCREALNPELSPPFEFRLLQGQSSALFLIIAPHLCTDAFAGTLLLNQIADEYKSEYQQSISALQPSSPLKSEKEQTTPKIDRIERVQEEHSYQQDDLLNIDDNRLQYVRAIKGILKDFVLPGAGVPTEYQGTGQRAETALLIKRIPSEQLTQVLRGARARGVKAHTLFTWGFKRALDQWMAEADLPPHQRLRIADLCTLRPLIAPIHAEEIDVLVQPYTHSIQSEWSESEALSKISAGLERQKRSGVLIDLKRAALYRLLPRLLPLKWVMNATFRGLFKTNVTTTNPGPAPINFENFGNLEVLDFVNFPQIAPPAELGIIYTTYRGELRIVCLYDESRWSETKLRSLIEGLWSEVLYLAEDKAE